MTFRLEGARPMHFSIDNVGIETDYGGRRFRSRLEARWAAMFDRLRWKWEYEPFDLSGYIPDFVVSFSRTELLVEVKPATRFDDLAACAKKICQSGWRGPSPRGDFLIVGSTIFSPASESAVSSFGLFGMWDRESDDGWQPADHAVAIRCATCALISFRHASAGWSCVSCGERNHRVNFETAARADVLAPWVEAGNDVRWRKGS